MLARQPSGRKSLPTRGLSESWLTARGGGEGQGAGGLGRGARGRRARGTDGGGGGGQTKQGSGERKGAEGDGLMGRGRVWVWGHLGARGRLGMAAGEEARGGGVEAVQDKLALEVLACCKPALLTSPLPPTPCLPPSRPGCPPPCLPTDTHTAKWQDPAPPLLPSRSDPVQYVPAIAPVPAFVQPPTRRPDGLCQASLDAVPHAWQRRRHHRLQAVQEVWVGRGRASQGQGRGKRVAQTPQEGT